MTKIYLPDVNFWLNAAFDSQKHHLPASAWFAAAGVDSCAFCRQTQTGFLRLATNRQAVGDKAVTLVDAWRMYDDLFADPRVVYSEEPADIEPRWRHFTQHRTLSPKVWNDAYLAAFAQAASFEVVTFDKGFSQYQNVSCTILS